MRSDAAAPKDRTQIRATALGYISEVFPLPAAASGATLAAQALRGSALGLRAGDVVTNIIVCVTTAAAGTAGVVNIGLYSSAYGKLAVSGDVNASLTVAGQVALALTAPYTATVDDLYYAVIDMTTAYGTTQPIIAAGSVTGVSAALSGKPVPSFLQSSQASLPTTITPSSSAISPWFAAN